jgi:hypothetical protein
VDIQAMLWIGDAWNIDDIHHRLLWDGNDGRAACQSRHVAAKSNLRHTRDILRTGTCVALDVASMSGVSLLIANTERPSPTLSSSNQTSFTKYITSFVAYRQNDKS